MLIRITDRCFMGCKHCMVDASGPEGEHMSWETFHEAIQFTLDLGAKALLISGGEPFEHPELLRFAQYASGVGKLTTGTNLIICVTSNGSFVNDPEKLELAHQLGLPIQVTNDPRYYPTVLDRAKFRHIPGLAFESSIRLITPCRRTRENRIKPNRVSPMCFNLRSATRSVGLLRAMTVQQLKGKLCTPSVNVDGTIVAGEMDTCHPIGKVGDSLHDIERELTSMRCGHCGLKKNLEPHHLNAIGEGYGQSAHMRDDQEVSARDH